MDFCLLSKFDDLLSDIFLDSQFLWFDTAKLNGDHRRPRIRSDKVLKVIQDQVLTTGKTETAVKELLKMDYFRHFLSSKPSRHQQEFLQHMKRYLNLYLPSAGFEIADTRRYGGAGRRVEACVIVTKDCSAGDPLPFCTGAIAHLAPGQEKDLQKGNHDISVLWSSTRQSNCLFLGPARFVNHDCDPNAKFVAVGPNSVSFQALKNIKCGDELTAFYGRHYFGENNCDCRCGTCEENQQGFFTPQDPALSPPVQSNARKRKHSAGAAELKRHRKRSSMPCVGQIDLEQLIGSPMNETDEGGDMPAKMTGSPLAKSFQPRLSSSAPPPATKQDSSPPPHLQEEEERRQVMSIHFLCNDDNDTKQQPDSASSRSSSISHSPLDLLCDAVLDAEYLHFNAKQEPQDAPAALTVVVQPVHPPNHPPHFTAAIKTDVDRTTFSLDHPDSAVGLSPLLDRSLSHPPLAIKREPSGHNHKPSQKHKAAAKAKAAQSSNDDDFLDDVSDLSSVCSSEDDEEKPAPASPDDLTDPLSSSTSDSLEDQPPKASPTTRASSHPQYKRVLEATLDDALRCTICERPLKDDQVTDTSAAADVQVANELATWTWSPSAAFTDWNPQRCPRCERHVRVFGQEWPNRKIHASFPLRQPSIPGHRASPPPASAKPKRRSRKQQHLRKASFTKTFLRSPPTPTSEIFDGVDSVF
ncbi:hypothetical protein DM01DRAFT_1336859 [Hesseltinella vesiculosa]|uniref:SET domain-containing protein n=1 Tax=Hesseltinella vesiculosa TaxID=101127 RepID=A0A1X2GFH0_9FUNG|nr:hypothetical protein DM01DRAFT_1336859 [Hesseltinella vesiculosa]